MNTVKLTLSAAPESSAKKSRHGRGFLRGRAHIGQRPQTREQWREAVNGAKALLLVDSSRQYGLITGGPVVNVERCQAVIEQGAAMSIRPDEQEVDALIRALAGQPNA